MFGFRARLVVLLFVLLSTALPAQLRVEVTTVPGFTPLRDTLFLVGSFSDWATADERFALHRQPDGSYAYAFTTPMPDFEFKVTRGNWQRVESGPLSEPIHNRAYVSNGQLRDTLRLEIAGWEDLAHRLPVLDSLQLTVTSVPAATPPDAALYVTGSFNGWTPRDENYRLRPDAEGRYHVRIPLRRERTEYKITRGSWTAIESRKNGLARPNRVYDWREGEPARASLTVAQWEDLTPLPLGLYAILLVLAAAQLLLLAAVILGLRPRNAAANRWLAGLLAVIAVVTLVRLAAFDKHVFQLFPKLILVSDAAYFLVPPLVLLCWRTWRDGNFKPGRRYLLLLLPATAGLLAYLPYLLANDFAFTTWVVTDQTRTFLRLASLAGWVFGLVVAVVGWRQWRRSAAGPARRFVRALGLWALVTLGFHTATVMAGLVTAAGGGTYWTDLFADATWLVLNGLGIIVSYYLLRRPGWFRRSTTATEASPVGPVANRLATALPRPATLAPSPASAIESGLADASPARPNGPPREASGAAPTAINRSEAEVPTGGTKTQPRLPIVVSLANSGPPGSMLEPADSPFTRELLRIMTTDHPYRNAKLTLGDLAKLMNLPSHQFSRQLNDGFGQGFFEFINAHRVAAFEELVRGGRHQDRTILALAFEVGFNSKTAFNRAVRKHRGRTPREIVQGLDNQPKKGATFG